MLAIGDSVVTPGKFSFHIHLLPLQTQGVLTLENSEELVYLTGVFVLRQGLIMLSRLAWDLLSFLLSTFQNAGFTRYAPSLMAGGIVLQQSV